MLAVVICEVAQNAGNYNEIVNVLAVMLSALLELYLQTSALARVCKYNESMIAILGARIVC